MNENFLWEHSVNSDFTIDQLGDVKIHGRAAQHIRLLTAESLPNNGPRPLWKEMDSAHEDWSYSESLYLLLYYHKRIEKELLRKTGQ
jgi:hypothetical protein